jgi:hypothetical protein
MDNLRTAAQRTLECLSAWSSGGRVDRTILGDLILQLEVALIQSADEKFCDANCVWTDHHPTCALAQSEPDLEGTAHIEAGEPRPANVMRQPRPEPFGWLYESKTGNRIFHLVSDDKRAFHADFKAAQQYPEGHKMTPLYTAPPLAESKSFNPDWDRVQALEESLREHMAEIHRLRDVMHSIVKADANDELGIEENLLAAARGALVQPKQTAMPPDIAKVLFENVESLYVEDIQQPIKWATMSEYASKSAAVPGRAEVLDRIKKAWNELQEKAMPEKDEPVAWGCFRDGVLLDDLVCDEASVDYWCESDEPEMQRLVKRALYTYPPKRKPLTEDEISTLSREMVKGDKSVNWLCRAIEKAHDIGVEK